MKIVHLCLGSFYPDNYSYQENMLPKFHKILGYDVEVIASTQSFDEHGRVCFLTNTGTYKNEYGIKVTRLPYKNKNKIWKKLKRYKGVYEAICASKPDILFIHGCQFLDINEVVRFLQKHKNVITYVDNHADFSNSASNWLSRNILHKVIWKRCAKTINPYVRTFYGVLPARVSFLTSMYKLPKEKCQLLVIGGDDENIAKAKEIGARSLIRNQYSIIEDMVLIVTGGKINRYRPETLNLMEAVISLHNPNVKLLVFGTVSEEYQQKYNQLCNDDAIIDVGWVNSSDTYNLFEAADLVVFPGLHSVMWEQAVAQGKACMFRSIPGFHHVDIGGNAIFLEDVSTNGIKAAVAELLNNKDKLVEMRTIAEEKGRTTFSYLDIARRCIQ